MNLSKKMSAPQGQIRVKINSLIVDLVLSVPPTATQADFPPTFVLAHQFLQGRKGQSSIPPRVLPVRKTVWHGVGTNWARNGHREFVSRGGDDCPSERLSQEACVK